MGGYRLGLSVALCLTLTYLHGTQAFQCCPGSGSTCDGRDAGVYHNGGNDYCCPDATKGLKVDDTGCYCDSTGTGVKLTGGFGKDPSCSASSTQSTTSKPSNTADNKAACQSTSWATVVMVTIFVLANVLILAY